MQCTEYFLQSDCSVKPLHPIDQALILLLVLLLLLLKSLLHSLRPLHNKFQHEDILCGLCCEDNVWSQSRCGSMLRERELPPYVYHQLPILRRVEKP